MYVVLISLLLSLPLKNRKRKGETTLSSGREYGREGEGCSLFLPIPQPKLRKVIYGKDGECAVKELYPALDIIEPLFNLKNVPNNSKKRLVKTVIQGLDKIRYLYKSDAYDYEKEYRLICTESDINLDKVRYEYQQQNDFSGRMRHYYEHEDLNIENLLVTDSLIMLGPCVPYRENICACIEVLKKRSGLLGPKIKVSKIPYRRS